MTVVAPLCETREKASGDTQERGKHQKRTLGADEPEAPAALPEAVLAADDAAAEAPLAMDDAADRTDDGADERAAEALLKADWTADETDAGTEDEAEPEPDAAADDEPPEAAGAKREEYQSQASTWNGGVGNALAEGALVLTVTPTAAQAWAE